MEKKSQGEPADPMKLLQELPAGLRPLFQEWLDDPLDDQVPPEWRNDFQTWKLGCLENIYLYGRHLVKELDSPPPCLAGVLGQVSDFWPLFKKYDLVPKNWDPDELDDDLVPVIRHEIRVYALRKIDRVEIPSQHVQLVFSALRDLLQGPRALRTGRGKPEKFNEKMFLYSLLGLLKAHGSTNPKKLAAHLLTLFYPERFPDYLPRNISELLEGFAERMGESPNS